MFTYCVSPRHPVFVFLVWVFWFGHLPGKLRPLLPRREIWNINWTSDSLSWHFKTKQLLFVLLLFLGNIRHVCHNFSDLKNDWTSSMTVFLWIVSYTSLLERVWKWKRCWFCHPLVTSHPTSFSNVTWYDDKWGDCEKILISVITEIPRQVLGFVLRPGKSLNADTGPECPRSKLQIPSRSRNSSRWTSIQFSR